MRAPALASLFEGEEGKEDWPRRVEAEELSRDRGLDACAVDRVSDIAVAGGRCVND